MTAELLNLLEIHKFYNLAAT